MTKIISVISILLISLTGCVYPNRQVTTVDNRPGLIITNAPTGSILYVNGLKVGNANLYNGEPNYLILKPGKHHVEVHQGGKVIESVDVFLGEGTKREVKVSGGN